MTFTPAPPISTLIMLIQKEIALLAGDRMLLLDYLVDQGANLVMIDESDKRRDEYLVRGCMAKVWLVPRVHGQILFLQADSDAAITKGLSAMLVRLFSGQKTQEILKTELHLLSTIGLQNVMGAQRVSGFDQMVRQIMKYAKKQTGFKIP